MPRRVCVAEPTSAAPSPSPIAAPTPTPTAAHTTITGSPHHYYITPAPTAAPIEMVSLWITVTGTADELDAAALDSIGASIAVAVGAARSTISVMACLYTCLTTCLYACLYACPCTCRAQGGDPIFGDFRGMPLRALSDATLRFDLALGVRRRHAPKVAKNRVPVHMSSSMRIFSTLACGNVHTHAHARDCTPVHTLCLNRSAFMPAQSYWRSFCQKPRRLHSSTLSTVGHSARWQVPPLPLNIPGAAVAERITPAAPHHPLGLLVKLSSTVDHTAPYGVRTRFSPVEHMPAHDRTYAPSLFLLAVPIRLKSNRGHRFEAEQPGRSF